MRFPVVGLVTAVALPTAGSLATTPTTLPSLSSQGENCYSSRRPWIAPRRPQVTPPAVWCKEEPKGGRDAAPAPAPSPSSRGSWAGGLSSWVSRAGFFDRSSPDASTPTGVGACWDGSKLGGGEGTGGGGGGGGKNGTDAAAPAGGMDGGGEGDDSVRVPNLSTTSDSSTSTTTSDGPCSAAEAGSGAPIKTGAVFEPWVWLSAIWGLYAVWLRRSPLVTKAMTSGVLALGGDVAAQFFEYQQQAGSGRKRAFLKDARRLMAVAIDSMLITGPALHCLYGLLERFIPTSTGGFAPATSHVLIDTFIFDPMFVASFFCITGLLENRSLKQDILPALRREFWPAVHGSWIVSFFFCPVQFLTFRYLPLEFRVLSVNVGDIAWTSVLSYFSHKAPPEAEEREQNLKVDGGHARKKRAPGERKHGEMINAGGKGIGRKTPKDSGGGRRRSKGSSSSNDALVGARA